MSFNRKNKYGNKTCRCWKGHQHDSTYEAMYCNKLNILEKAGDIQSYKTQVRYTFKINGSTICSHYPDFEVVENDGRLVIHEFKGAETEVWRIKKKLFQALYPEIPYYVKKRSDLCDGL